MPQIARRSFSMHSLLAHSDLGMIRVMNSDPAAARLVPAKPTLDGIEDKWSSAWEKECVVQV